MSDLSLNFKDDVLNASMGGRRRYRMINNADGTVSLEDVSSYDVTGSEFGSQQVNEMVKSLYGFIPDNVTFNDDGSISEVLGIGKKETAFNDDGSITETLTDKQGNKIINTTVFNADGSITSTVTNG